MLVILISLIIGVSIIVLFHNKKVKYFAIMIGSTIIIIGIIIGIFGATNYYEERELLSSGMLLPLDTEKGDCIFVKKSKENVYIYEYQIALNVICGPVEISPDSSRDIIEIEDPNCEVPEVLLCIRKAKPTIWTFGFKNSKMEYILHVPKGTIKRE